MISEKIKAVIFDVDGVIIDSEPSWQKTHNEFLEENNISVDEKYKESFRGIGLKELVEQLRDKFHLEKSVDELLDQYRKIFYRNFFDSKEEKMLVGVEELIRSCYDRGYVLAIATGGHTKASMEKILETFNLLHFFSVIVSSDEVHRGKPHPDVFLHAAEKLGRKPEECLVIEDSVNGVQAGKKAGMYVIGINSDKEIYNELKKNGADEVFYSLSEIKI